MKQQPIVLSVGGMLAALIFAVLGVSFLTGCEEAGKTTSISISPSAATLADNGDTQVFAVSATNMTIGLPLKWSVTDSARGTIIRQSGNSAVYKRLASGDNIVIARDQYDSEGYATVSQP